MKFARLLTVAAACSFLSLSACKDDDDTTKPTPVPQPETGKVTLQLNNVVDNEPLVLNAANYYTSPGNQQYRIGDFKYYLSNLKFYGANFSQYAEPESYHLVNQQEANSLKIVLPEMKPGTYDSLLFAVGVDNNRNHSGAQTGALDPSNGMAWDWNIGYKFLVLEGSSPAAPGPSNTLLYHIGLDPSYRLIRLALSPALVVTKNSSHTIKVKADVNRLFGTPQEPVLFDQMHTVMGVTNSTLIADNYAKMFSFQQLSAD